MSTCSGLAASHHYILSRSAETAARIADSQPLGTVVFAGAEQDSQVDGATPRFVVGATIHWQARFSEPANAARIQVVAVRRIGTEWEQVVDGRELWLTHPAVSGYTGWIGPGGYGAPGRYLLRLVRGGTVLAEGEFEVAAGATKEPRERLH